VIAAQPVYDQRQLADAHVVALRPLQIPGKRRHAVVLVAVEALMGGIAHHAEHPFIRTVACEVGGNPQGAVLTEAMAIKAVVLDQLDAGRNVLLVELRFATLQPSPGLGGKGGGDLPPDLAGKQLLVLFEKVFHPGAVLSMLRRTEEIRDYRTLVIIRMLRI